MVDDATATMIANLPERTGRSLDQWLAVLAPLGLSRHSEVVGHLKGEHGMGHGYANLVAQRHLAAGVPPPDDDDLVAAQYQGPKSALRPIYDRIVAFALDLGDDVEVAPKKASVSLRRRKQFALVTPAARTRIDLGLNLPGEPPTERLLAAGGMCTHKVAVAAIGDVDDELRGLLRRAYERA
jgi:hypothetical protein